MLVASSVFSKETPYFKSDFTNNQGRLELFSKNFKDYTVKKLGAGKIDGEIAEIAEISIPDNAKGSYFYLQIKLPTPLPVRKSMRMTIRLKNFKGSGCVGVIAKSQKKNIWCYFPRIGGLGKNSWRDISLELYPSLMKQAEKTGVISNQMNLTKIWFRFVGKRNIKFAVASVKVDYLKSLTGNTCEPNSKLMESLRKKLVVTKIPKKIKNTFERKLMNFDALENKKEATVEEIVDIRIKLDEMDQEIKKSVNKAAMEELLK
jgi:hypothetical protein